MTRLLLVLLLAIVTPVTAAPILDIPAPLERLYSFSVGSGAIPCDGDDQVLMSIPDPQNLGAWPFSVGAGIMPATAFNIVGASITHQMSTCESASSYLVIGNTQPDGDIITPWLLGCGERTTFFPAGRFFHFPNVTSEMHVHARCPLASGAHWFNATIFYAAPAPMAGGGFIRVSWQGVVAPTTRDWIGIYPVGAADGAYLGWLYAGACAQAPDRALAVGACLIALPTQSGVYELRLFSNDGYSRLATSPMVTVP